MKFLTIAIGLDEEGNRMEIVVWGVQLVASCTYFLFKRKKMHARRVPYAATSLVPGPKAAFQLQPSLCFACRDTAEGISEGTILLFSPWQYNHKTIMTSQLSRARNPVVRGAN